MAGHQRTAGTRHPGGRRTGRHPGGQTPRRADTPAGGGQATGGRYTTDGHTCLRYDMGEGRIRREPQRGGREYASTKCGCFILSSVLIPSSFPIRQ